MEEALEYLKSVTAQMSAFISCSTEILWKITPVLK